MSKGRSGYKGLNHKNVLLFVGVSFVLNTIFYFHLCDIPKIFFQDLIVE